ncbi:MAG: DSD1 family PLP-dependent enzyme [Alphaproteobacteria bacterium]|nr:DSD1 family PLP-dependent enzyme [Alphaproteobacteria bacterium]
MSATSSNATLIGIKGSRQRLDTPCLVLDLDMFESNLAAMHGWARDRCIALRPHAKTHKCATIGKRQMEAGAIGLCCAKLGEAEALTDHGLEHLMLTSPVTGRAKIDRLLALNARLPDLTLVVDDPENLAELEAAARIAGQQLRLLIDVDVGTHRFGVISPDQALALADTMAASPALNLMGIQGYAGHCQAITDYHERLEVSHRALGVLAGVRDALIEADHACDIVTGSGTGTHDVDQTFGLLTDLQVGSYVFSDVTYDRVTMTADGERRVQPALFVHSRVVSRCQKGYATIDAGSKSFSMDGPMPILVDGPTPGSEYGRFGDEFGRVSLEGVGRDVALGELTTWMVPHCDPTLNLYDTLHCVRGDTLVEIWPIEARGAAG